MVLSKRTQILLEVFYTVVYKIKDEYLYAYDYAKRNKDKDITSLLDDNH